MIAGAVRWFDARKGYGFIQPTDGTSDVFLHIRVVERAGLRKVPEGQKVTFDIESDNRGRTRASNLRLVA